MTTPFRALHQGPDVLLLPNAWDALSARLVEDLGAKAVATTSAGLAWSRGWPDGNALPPDELVAAMRSIVRVVKVPVSADIEDGYSETPSHVAELVDKLCDVGVVGLNIEDGFLPADGLCKKIEAIQQRCAARGVDLFVNARTDVFLKELGPPAERRAEAIRRGLAFRDAGASGLFVPRVVTREDIGALVQQVPLPLSVIACEGLPTPRELGALGVRRLSAGSTLALAAFGRASAVAGQFLRGEDGAPDREGALDYVDVNSLFR